MRRHETEHRDLGKTFEMALEIEDMKSEVRAEIMRQKIFRWRSHDRNLADRPGRDSDQHKIWWKRAEIRRESGSERRKICESRPHGRQFTGRTPAQNESRGADLSMANLRGASLVRADLRTQTCSDGVACAN